MADEIDVEAVRKEHNSLFQALKTTTEVLLSHRNVNVWNTYGGLTRVCNDVEKILKHRLKAFQGSFDPTQDFWGFIIGLRWLHPILAPPIELNIYSAEGFEVRNRSWVQQSLQEHSLSSQLKILIHAKEHLYSCYQANAFLCNPHYVQAMLICLEAIEQNKVCLLAEIDPNLMLNPLYRISHSRSYSFPTSTPCNSYTSHRLSIDDLTPKSLFQDSSLHLEINLNKEESIEFGVDPLCLEPVDNLQVVSKEMGQTNSQFIIDEKSLCNSSDMVNNRHIHYRENMKSIEPDSDESHFDLNEQIDNDLEDNAVTSSTVPSNNKIESIKEQSTEQSVQNTFNPVRKSAAQHMRSKSDFTFPKYSDGDPLISDVGQSADNASLSSSLPVHMEGRRPSFLDEGGSSILPSTECFFPQPTVGQSLTSFLSSQEFHTCAELDKENAHFSISEALIAAIEQMQCNRILRSKNTLEDEEEDGDSDDEIQQLKQRIRVRRRERQREKAKHYPLLSDGRTDTTTSQSGSPPNSPQDSAAYSGHSSSDSVDEIEYTASFDSNLRSLSESGVSLSVATLYSDADIRKGQECSKTNSYEKSLTDYGPSHMSAESVALCLLSKFSEKHLPKASDLEWLVSEQDAPQSLLPLPTSWPVSPDEAEDVQLLKQTRLRGNFEWAPPRAQIIFNIHPAPKLKVIMAKQNYRCAGCGMRIEPAYIKRFRYCEYLGKYFCQCCHSNCLAFIPGRIMRKWDFTKYYVSNFSRDLLNKLFTDPLFNILDINPSLYRKVRSLYLLRELRLQLFHLRNFLRTCRLAENYWLVLQEQPSHWITEPHVYSLQDLLQVKSGELLIYMRKLIIPCLSHVAQCELCLAKGFICEFCNNAKDVIFPFQLQKVTQCSVCQSCFHQACFVPEKCPKCIRIEVRKSFLASLSNNDDENLPD